MSNIDTPNAAPQMQPQTMDSNGQGSNFVHISNQGQQGQGPPNAQPTVFPGQAFNAQGPFNAQAPNNGNGNVLVIREITCGNCGRNGHEGKQCIGPTDEYGFIAICPTCNVKSHTYEFCTFSRFTKSEKVHVLLQLRDQKPQLACSEDIRGMEGFGYRGTPWTRQSAIELTRNNPDYWKFHHYPLNWREEPRQADPTWNNVPPPPNQSCPAFRNPRMKGSFLTGGHRNGREQGHGGNGRSDRHRRDRTRSRSRSRSPPRSRYRNRSRNRRDSRSGSRRRDYRSRSRSRRSRSRSRHRSYRTPSRDGYDHGRRRAIESGRHSAMDPPPGLNSRVGAQSNSDATQPPNGLNTRLGAGSQSNSEAAPPPGLSARLGAALQSIAAVLQSEPEPSGASQPPTGPRGLNAWQALAGIEQLTDTNQVEEPLENRITLQCTNCGFPGHLAANCWRSCRKCGKHANHKSADGHIRNVCKCKEFPAHVSKECKELCNNCKEEHPAMNCSKRCAMCGSWDHSAWTCSRKTCPVDGLYHLGQNHYDQYKDCQIKGCGLYNCKDHCQTCGSEAHTANGCLNEIVENWAPGRYRTLRCPQDHPKWQFGFKCLLCHPSQTRERQTHRTIDADGFELVGNGNRNRN